MSTIALSDITIGKRHRKELGDIAGLAASIEDVGLLQPIVIDRHRRLIAGYRRVRAFEQLKRSRIPAVIATNLEEAVDRLKAERDENVCRLAMRLDELHVLGTRLAKVEKPAAKARQAEGRKKGASKGGKTAGRGRPKAEQPSGQVTTKANSSIKSRDRIAAGLGIALRAKRPGRLWLTPLG